MIHTESDSNGHSLPILHGARIIAVSVELPNVVVALEFEDFDEVSRVNSDKLETRIRIKPLKLKFNECVFIYVLSEGPEQIYDPMYIDGLYAINSVVELAADEFAQKHIGSLTAILDGYLQQAVKIAYFAPLSGTVLVIGYRQFHVER